MRSPLAAAVALLLLSSAAAIAAPEVKVTAAFSALEIRPDDLVSYTITLAGEELPRLRQDPRPDFSDFRVASGPSRGSSSSINMTGGRAQVNASLKLSWQLMPKGGREGELSVPGFMMTLGNQSHRVPPATVKSSLDAQPRARSRGGRSSRQDPFSRSRRDGNLDNVHLEVRERISGREVYLGEELILTHVLEFGPGAVVRTFDPEPTDFKGFEKQERKVEHAARRVSGESWQEVPLAQWRLVPLTVGRREIPARGYVLHLQASPRDIFDGFFSSGEKQLRRATRPVELLVKPLPPAAPREFAGAVGTFQVESSLGTQSLAQGDGTTLTVVVRGTGNFSAVQSPQLRLPAGVRAFDPEIRVDTRPGRDGRTQGSKIFDYPLLIESAGDFEFEPLSWSYFDPKSGRYVTRQTRPITLHAEPSAAPSAVSGSGGARTSLVETLDTDIEHVLTAWTPVVEREAAPSGLPPWFWPLLFAGPLLPIAGVVWSFSRRVRREDATSTRSKQAGKEARGRLATAQAAAKAGRIPEAADAAAATISRFVVDRCGVGGAEPVAAEVVELVRERAGEDLAERVRAHLADCDFLRFAGASAEATEARQRADDAKRLLDELERALTKAPGGSS